MSLIISVSLFLIITIILLPLNKIFPKRNLRKLVLLLNEDGHKEDDTKNTILDRIFFLCQRICSTLNIKISKEKYDRYKTKLILAGVIDRINVECFMGTKVLSSIIAFIYLVLLFVASGAIELFILILTLPILAFFVPDIIIKNKISNRQWQMQKELPNILSTLAIITDAGLTFSEAIKKVCEVRKGVLVKELKKMTEEINMGIIQKEALFRLSERCQVNEISSFVFTLTQSLEKGASGVSLALKELSKEAWEKRTNRARELAEKASIKLFLPMIFLVFPSLVIFILGPAVISIIKMFS